MENSTAFRDGSLLVLLACAFAADIAADVPEGTAVGPATEAIRLAAVIVDPVRREETLRSAIRDGLLAPDGPTRGVVFGYLGDNMRWLDLRPFVDILEEFSTIDKWKDRGLGLADDVELFRSAREHRLEVYGQAIKEGEVTLPRGTKLPRFAAMLLAAEDGLQELKAVIKSHYEQLSKESKAAYPLDRLLLTLELKAGAADREDGARLACKRLDAMSDEQFAQRMDSGTSFRTVVLGVSEYACNVDPFRHWRNAGCASIKDIVRRQAQLRVHRQEQTRGAGQPRQVLPGEEISWLDRLRSASAGELRVPCK